MAIKLGDKVKDVVTGFEGIAIAKTQWLYGCDRFCVQGPMNKDGKVPDAQTFDEKQGSDILASEHSGTRIDLT